MNENEIKQDEIIRMALEAGGVIYEVDWCFEIENLERFATLVAAHERERCFRICEEMRSNDTYQKPYEDYGDGYLDACNDCASAIFEVSK